MQVPRYPTRGIKSIADWGLLYYTVCDLAAALSWRTIVSGQDVNNGFYIAPMPGYTSELVVG